MLLFADSWLFGAVASFGAWVPDAKADADVLQRMVRAAIIPTFPEKVIRGRFTGPDGNGRHKTAFCDFGHKHQEQWVVGPGDAFGIWGHGITLGVLTRDCPTLVLYRKHNDPVVVIHGGRDCLHAIGTNEPSRSAIEQAFHLLVPEWKKNPEEVRGYLLTGICAKHFPNDRYPEVVGHFRERWGVGASPDLVHLDLEAAIRGELKLFGIKKEQIKSDGICTFEDSRCGSMRAGRPGHNLILVCKR